MRSWACTSIVIVFLFVRIVFGKYCVNSQRKFHKCNALNFNVFSSHRSKPGRQLHVAGMGKFTSNVVTE